MSAKMDKGYFLCGLGQMAEKAGKNVVANSDKKSESWQLGS